MVIKNNQIFSSDTKKCTKARKAGLSAILNLLKIKNKRQIIHHIHIENYRRKTLKILTVIYPEWSFSPFMLSIDSTFSVIDTCFYKEENNEYFHRRTMACKNKGY